MNLFSREEAVRERVDVRRPVANDAPLVHPHVLAHEAHVSVHILQQKLVHHAARAGADACQRDAEKADDEDVIVL